MGICGAAEVLLLVLWKQLILISDSELALIIFAADCQSLMLDCETICCFTNDF